MDKNTPIDGARDGLSSEEAKDILATDFDAPVHEVHGLLAAAGVLTSERHDELLELAQEYIMRVHKSVLRMPKTLGEAVPLVEVSDAIFLGLLCKELYDNQGTINSFMGDL